MTREQLIKALEPIAEEALRSTNEDVLKIAVVLATIIGCVGNNDPESLDVLARTAGLICEHHLGLHRGGKDGLSN